MIDFNNTILFPEIEKIGYKKKNKVFFFSAKSLTLEKTIEFPFEILFFSYPFEEEFILVVDINKPNILLLYNYLQFEISGLLTFNNPILKFISSNLFHCLVFKNGASIISSKPLLQVFNLETNDIPSAISLINDPNDLNHCYFAHSDEISLGYLVIHRIPSSMPPITFSAHKSKLICCSISYDAKFIVTTSKTGTIVRLWSIDGKLLNESRRGFFNALIQHISFSPDSKYFCVSSSHLTSHIFRTNKKMNDDTYFLTKAEVKVPLEQSKSLNSYVLSGGENLCLITDKGSCLLYSINLNNGEYNLKSEINFPNIIKFLDK